MNTDTALVTGAGGGLGRAIAQALFAAGFKVAVADIDAAAAQEVSAALDETGKRAIAIVLDVRDKTQWNAAIETTVAQLGSLEVLVNNAARTVIRPLMEIPPEEFDDVIAVNLRGCFLGSQVAGTYFRVHGYGRIINLASLAGQNGGTATGGHYAASKGGILSLTKAFARELAGDGITVNAIAPGPLDLPVVYQAVGEDRIDAFRNAIPVRQLGDPAFVASLIALLASRQANFATGATFDVNGGLYLR